MPYCPDCGAGIEGGTRFCPECGTAIEGGRQRQSGRQNQSGGRQNQQARGHGGGHQHGHGQQPPGGQTAGGRRRSQGARRRRPGDTSPQVVRSPGPYAAISCVICTFLVLEGGFELFFTEQAMAFWGVQGSLTFWRVTGGAGFFMGLGLIALSLYYYSRGEMPRLYFGILIAAGFLGLIPLGLLSQLLLVPVGLYGLVATSN